VAKGRDGVCLARFYHTEFNDILAVLHVHPGELAWSHRYLIHQKISICWVTPADVHGYTAWLYFNVGSLNVSGKRVHRSDHLVEQAQLLGVQVKVCVEL
jgi:hypothetical protein